VTAAAPFTPRPGSSAERAITYLGKMRCEVPTADLARAIHCTPYGLGSTLGRAVKSGLIVKRQHKPGVSAPCFWSLPETTQAAAPVAAPKAAPVEPVADIPVVQRVVPAAQAGPSGWAPHPLDAAWHPRAQLRGVYDPNKPLELDVPKFLGEQNTPQKGANRDATGFEGNGSQGPDATDCEARSKVMAPEGSESPTGRVLSEPALGAAPVFHDPDWPGDDAKPAVRAAVPDAGPLVGRTATVSMTGEIAVVSDCGVVILFQDQRAQQLRDFFAGRVG
jgi:hypothetical protein